MKRDRWERVNAILDLALEADPRQRDAIVAAECGDDAELAADVARFLAACSDATSLFETAPQELVNAAFAAAGVNDGDELRTGDVVGAYRVVEKIGSGGMGAVYHAERADGEFEKRVALKVIRRGQDTDEVVSRFHDERRILARLQHPNIAALLDGGVAAVGPYFVMEYAPGEPIDRYLRRSGAGLEERLRLFVTVCDAVHYAHQNLIVHRDLKPSNVLVSKGEPKLLDFGIAKVLDPETGMGVVVTQVTELRLTPQYAAPEQVLGQPVTTATDVYALGMILYELLAGRTPYDVHALPMVEIVRAVCKVDPAPPSVTAKSDREKTESGAIGIGWRIPRDLDAVVLKALQKSPTRRYGSVAAFAEDLRRFLDGRPVRARPDTFLYRASKFIRRNAAVVGLGTAAALTLMIGVVATIRQTRIAAAERDRAEEETAQATAALDFLVNTFGAFDPDRLSGQFTFSHQDLIDAGLRNLEALSREPEVRAPIMNTLARVIFNLGERARADSLYAEAYTLLEPAAPHPALAASLMGIGLVRLRDLRFPEAIEAYRNALAMRREVFPAEDPAIVESMTSLAFALYTMGAGGAPSADTLLAEAEALYQEALVSVSEPTLLRARALEGLGDIELARADALLSAGDSASWREQLTRAEEHYREAIRTGIFAVNDTTPDDARRMWGLAEALNQQGSLDGAVEASRQALAVLERTYGESHPDVALAHFYLGAYLNSARRFGDAASSYERSAELSGGNVDHRSPYTGIALVRAGRARLQATQPTVAISDLESGIRWFQAALEVGEVSQTALSDNLGGAHLDRAKALTQLGNPRAAVDDFRSALELWGRELDRPQLASARVSRVRQYVAEGSTLLAAVFDLLQQQDSARHYRARAAAHSAP